MEPVIIFEDKWLMVCQKPAGLPVQSARVGAKDMVSILKNYRSTREKCKGEPYLGVIHRLDQPVEGLLVFAKTKEAAADLSAQAAGSSMRKEYLAVVPGVPGEREGGLTDYLLKDGKTNTSSVVKKGTKGAKEARLYYHVLKEKEDRFLVEIQLFTGRHHQIRVQMANAGMPLLGDAKYGRSEGREPLALCAARLSFCHPSTKEQLSFSCTPKGTAFKEFYE